MSRKNASYMWDDCPDSPEEQAKNMAEIDAIIFGATNKPGKEKKKKERKESDDKNETGFSNDLLSSILERNGVEDIEVDVEDEEDMTTDVVRKDKPEVKEERHPIETKPEDSSSLIYMDNEDDDDEVDAVTFMYLDELRRIIVDDGIAPTSYAIDETDWTDRDLEDNAENWSEEDFVDISGAIMDCIVTFAYPTAVIDIDEYKNYLETGMYDREEFQFYKDDEYIFCYRIKNYKEFRDALVDEYGRKKTLQILRNLLYKASNPHESFDAKNAGAVALYANMFDEDDIKEFAEVFNANTIESADGKFHVYDIIRSQEECRDMIEEVSEEDEEDDDPEIKNEVLPDTEEDDVLTEEEQEELEDSIDEYVEDTEDDIASAIDGISDLDDTEDDDDEDADDDFSDLADSDDLVVDVVRKN